MLATEPIPTTFAEFYAAKPDFVRQIICKEHWAPFDDAADLEQDLLTALIHRQTIEKFNSDIYGDAVTIRHFMAYVKECCRRNFLTLLDQTKQVKRSLNHTATSLSDLTAADSTTTVADTLSDDGRSLRAIEALAEFDRFAAYIDRTSPHLSHMVEAIRVLGSANNRDLANHLGVSFSTITYRMKRLAKLRDRWLAIS